VGERRCLRIYFREWEGRGQSWCYTSTYQHHALLGGHLLILPGNHHRHTTLNLQAMCNVDAAASAEHHQLNACIRCTIKLAPSC
jgi:hypothetical protein